MITFDILTWIFVKSYILSVNDPCSWFVMPATVLAVLSLDWSLVTVVEKLEAEHVRVMEEDVTGGDVDDDLALGVVLLLVHQQQHLVIRTTLVKNRGGGRNQELVFFTHLELVLVNGYAHTQKIRVFGPINDFSSQQI